MATGSSSWESSVTSRRVVQFTQRIRARTTSRRATSGRRKCSPRTDAETGSRLSRQKDSSPVEAPDRTLQPADRNRVTPLPQPTLSVSDETVTLLFLDDFDLPARQCYRFGECRPCRSRSPANSSSCSTTSGTVIAGESDIRIMVRRCMVQRSLAGRQPRRDPAAERRDQAALKI